MGLRDLTGLCALLICVALSTKIAAAETLPAAPSPSLDDFLAKPIYSHAQLSPDGRSLAYVRRNDDGCIVIVKTLDDSQNKVILRNTDKNISVEWLKWKDNKRIVLGFSLWAVKRWGDKPNDDIISIRSGSYMVGVDRDGKNTTSFLKKDFRDPDRGHRVVLVDRLKDDPDHILAATPDGNGSTVWKVDIHTGDGVKIEFVPDSILFWFTDRTGVIVARYRIRGTDIVVESRSIGDKNWNTITTIRKGDFKLLEDFDIKGFSEKPNQLYVLVKPKFGQDGDFKQLRIYDIASRTLSAPVWPNLKADIEDIVSYEDSLKLAGICYTIDTYRCDFSDPKFAAHYKALLKYFEDDRNVTPISISEDGGWWLLNVSGPDEPSGYYLYEKATASITFLAERYEKLPSDQLALMKRYHYVARDGVDIPGYLTQPRDAPKGPMPLIVMPHGGPEARDAFEYDNWVQFFATRGYLVFQPNFRGSSGYGVSYAEAGYRQRGGRMADDITDGVQALIKSGQADPARICIFGASHGGYAALYAGATHPELYKCVVSWAGISDFKTFLSERRRAYGAESAIYKYDLKSIGDPAKDADMLQKTSPLTYAENYKPPVLLIHGEDDYIVESNQSWIMKEALKRAGRSVKMIVFKNEGHPHWEAEDEKVALTDILDFIETYVPSAASTSKPATVMPGTPTKP